MKKIFLLSILLVSTNLILSQTEQGKFVISGATSLQFMNRTIEYEYEGSSIGESKTNSFSILPSVSYFVIDNLAIGLFADFTSVSQDDSRGKIKSKSIILLPSALYYFAVKGDLKPVAQVGLGYGTITSESESGYFSEFKSKESGLAVNFGGGVAYFINEFVSLNFGLAYTMANLKDSDDSDYVMKHADFSAKVGISVFL